MMDFIYELYQNDNFVIYLTIILVILIVLFVLVLIFGKKDQKLEETKKLQKIDIDTFKEEKTKEVKLEVKQVEVNKVSEVKEDVPKIVKKEEEKPLFVDTTSLSLGIKGNDLKEQAKDESISVTTFEPKQVETYNLAQSAKKADKPVPLVSEEDNVAPINMKELDEIKFDDNELEKDLGELANIKKEIENIEIPEVRKEEKIDTFKLSDIPEVPRKREVEEVKLRSERMLEKNKETKTYKAGPQVFSSVFVKREDAPEIKTDVPEVKPNLKEEKKEEKVAPVIKANPTKINLLSIEDEEEEIELPPLKGEVKKEETKKISFDDITGESYNIK